MQEANYVSFPLFQLADQTGICPALMSCSGMNLVFDKKGRGATLASFHSAWATASNSSEVSKGFSFPEKVFLPPCRSRVSCFDAGQWLCTRGPYVLLMEFILGSSVLWPCPLTSLLASGPDSSWVVLLKL